MIWVIIPIALACVSFFGSWAVYGLALSYNHVCSLSNWDYRNSCQLNTSELCCTHVNIPTISTSGANAPENSLFTATINAGAFLFMVFCILHHAHVLERNSSQSLLSKAALVFGCVSAIGAFMAGNCNWLFVGRGLYLGAVSPRYLMLLHYLGAALSFVCLCFYCLLLTVLTGKCALTGLAHILYPARVASTCIQIFVTICYCIFFAQEELIYKHMSAVFEWTLSVNLELFELSFVFEFYNFSSSMLSVLLEKRDEEKSLILS